MFIDEGWQSRLLVNMPPGSLKSYLVTVCLQAWEWGPLGRPDRQYLTTTYRDDYATRDARRTRDLIESEWYQERWPVRLTSRGETYFANEARGHRMAVPFGSLTSGRGDRIIVDDPHSVDTAESDADRDRITRRFRESVPLRLNDPRDSAIIVVMHRLHQHDVSGEIERLGLPYVHLMLPMEFEVERKCCTPFGEDRRRREGELLFPERWTAEVIERDKQAVSDYAWASQMQQRPSPRTGGMFERHKAEIVAAAPAEARRVRAWDLAATIKRRGAEPSWTAGVLMAKDRKGLYYVEDVARLRASGGEVEGAIRNLAKLDNDRAVTSVRLPQDPGQAGKVQSEYLSRMLAGYIVTAKPVSGAKETRAAPFASQWQAGNVRIVQGRWNDSFIEELCSFPTGTHDDQVDAAADAFGELALGSTYDTSLAWVR